MKRHNGNMYYKHHEHPEHDVRHYSPPAVLGLAGEVACLLGYEAATTRVRGRECGEAEVMWAAQVAASVIVRLWRGPTAQDPELTKRCGEMAAIVAEDAERAIRKLPEGKRPL